MQEFPIDDDTDDEPKRELPFRRYSIWQYLALAFVVCVLVVILFPFLMLVSTVGVVVLSAGALGAFLYWLLFGRRGLIRRWLRYRNLQARRRNRWLLRAAERGRRRTENSR